MLCVSKEVVSDNTTITIVNQTIKVSSCPCCRDGAVRVCVLFEDVRASEHVL